MIKKITAIRKTESSAEYDALCELLRRLGLEEGGGWSEPGSRGKPFRASIGELEFVDGQAAVPELLIEVSELEPVEKVARAFAAEHHGLRVEVSAVEETTWKSQILRVTVGSVEIGFWSYDDPEKNVVAAVEGELNASGMRVGIVVSRWNQVITERLLHGALDALRRSGARREDVTVVRVPGAFELPSGARALAESGKVDAVITLGCLIRGETTHYEHIAEEATRGIGQSAQETGIPHAYGLLTCETLEQALDRAGLKAGNKGFEAAMSAVEMVSVGRKLRN
jgi:6,7-dimethyl-8-ribityllumazine synthase